MWGRGIFYLDINVTMVLQQEVLTVRYHPAVRYNAAGPIGHRVQSPSTVFGEPVTDDDCCYLHIFWEMAPAITQMAGFVGSAGMFL